MKKNKYIEVIDHYNRLKTDGIITYEVAWWASQAVIMCAMKASTTTVYDYCYICEYRDRLFKQTPPMSR